MSQVYLSGHQQVVAAIDGKVVRDDNVSIECINGADDNGLCFLNGLGPSKTKTLMKTLEDDFPSGKAISKASFPSLFRARSRSKKNKSKKNKSKKNKTKKDKSKKKKSKKN